MAGRPRAEKPLSNTVTVRLGDELSADMRALSERDGIPFSEQIRRALQMFLEAKGIRRIKSKKKTA